MLVPAARVPRTPSLNQRTLIRPSIRCTVFIHPSQPLAVELQIQNVPVRMEVDTGASLSTMSHQTYSSTWSKECLPPLKPTEAKLCTYTGERIDVPGAIKHWGEDRCPRCHQCRCSIRKLEGQLESSHRATKLYVKPSAQPNFCQACQVPFAIREKVEQEIDRQVEGILEPVKFSE